MMKNIKFTEHVLPHLLAVAVFLIVTVFFFNPVFFDRKVLSQNDINEHRGMAQSLVEHREKTGEEGLWVNSMFSGMPGYLVNVFWSNEPITYLKNTLSLFLPHPVCNIFLAFICYYIMLLAFNVRPYLAIAGAIAFGLSSYMIVGISAGHNSRVGAIAFMPLVMAGIHMAFTNRKLLGFGVTVAGLALHLNENHLQITFYLLMIAGIYGIIRLVEAVKEKTVADYLKTIGMLCLAALLAVGTFFGQLWSIQEYTAFSIRGKSELIDQQNSRAANNNSGLSKEYAFEFSNGMLEPLTLIIPNIYGGSSGNYLVMDQKSATYKALVNSGDQRMANQLAGATSSYWGPQRLTMPYYAGAIVVFLFAVGIAFAERKYIWWLVFIAIIGVVLSWGSNFPTFNYFLFDYLPGYNKFRSVTFALVMILFAMPLLGLLGLERLWNQGLDKHAKKKLLIALASTGGLCLLILLFAGMFSFTKEGQQQLPPWFLNAMADDRKSLLRSDAFRSLSFILGIFILIYFNVIKKSALGFYIALILFITIDLAVVDKRYLTKDNFTRKNDKSFFAMTEADQEILKDKSYYRVYNLQGGAAFAEARTSYYHKSIGGYHGAKMRRYQDFYDSCLFRQTQQFYTEAQQGNIDMNNLGSFNMLNIKYIVYGPQRNNIFPNSSTNGPAWFVQNVVKVNSPAEELEKVCSINTRTSAVIDASHFTVPDAGSDSVASITLIEQTANFLKYESQSTEKGLAVFSEIYYPKGWIATIDGTEAPILRANYILRALEIPAGKHTIEFRFQPKAYTVGNKITMASSWLAVLIFIGSISLSLRSAKEEPVSKPSVKTEKIK